MSNDEHRTSKPVLSDDIEYDKSGVVRVKPEAMLRRVKEYIAAHKEDDTKAPASNSSAAVLRSWSGVVVDRNLSSDLAIAADEIERLEFQVYALTNANKSLLDRAAGQPPNRHTDEPSVTPDAWMSEDGRIISRDAKEFGSRHPTAKSASDPFTIPLYRAAVPPNELRSALRDSRRYVEAYTPRDVSEAHDRDLMLNSIDALLSETKDVTP